MTLTCTRGETPAWNIACLRDNLPVDLTGATLTFAAKGDLADAVPLIEHTIADGGIIVSNAAAGLCILKLAAVDTTQFDSISPHSLDWDIRLVELDGTVTVVASGALVIAPNIA